jgi:hypothetical protein
MLALQRATAATTVGFDASPEPAAALGVELVLAELLAAGGAELVELVGAALLLLLLLPPQPAINAPPAATTASREQRLRFIGPPQG